MKRVKKRLGVDGHCRYVFAAMILSIAVLNISSGLLKGIQLHIIAIYSIPFVILSIASIFLSTKLYLTIIYTIAGMYSILSPSGVGDYSASIFFIFAFHLNKHKIYAIMAVTFSSLSIAVTLNKDGVNISTFFNMLLAYAVVYTTYYFLIYKQHEQEKQDLINSHIKEMEQIKNKALRIDTLGLKEKEKAMIKMYVNGYSYAQISEFLGLNITSDTVRRNIWEIKKNSKTNNEAHFCKWLHDVV